MKTASTAMTTHLAQSTTTVTHIWSLVRQDGTAKYFTSLDVDIEYLSNAYLASTGFSRTNIEGTSDLSIDNLQVLGIFSESGIDEKELEAGYYDHAEFVISLINYEDVSMGVVELRRGRVGKTTRRDDGTFEIQLSGMIAALDQNVIDVYQTLCRVEVGHPKCGIPIKPDLRANSTAYALGDFVRVATAASTKVYDQVVQNPRFEHGTEAEHTGTGVSGAEIPGWTIADGIQFYLWDSAHDGLSAEEGTGWLQGGTGNDGECSQDVDIGGAVGNFARNVQQGADGNFRADFSIERANNDINDEGRVKVEFLDEDRAFISDLYDSTAEAISPLDTWTTRSVTNVAIPAAARYIRIRLMVFGITGAEIHSCFDSVAMSLYAGIPAFRLHESHEQYENRIYECTTAGTSSGLAVAFDTTVGNTTTDGSVTWTCREAWSRQFTVETVLSPTTFVAKLNGSSSWATGKGSGWWNHGNLVFETGDVNTDGRAYEVKNSTLYTSVVPDIYFEVELHRQPIEPIGPGQIGYISPGCDGQVDTCVAKFDNIDNFRGFPNVPGADAITRAVNVPS